MSKSFAFAALALGLTLSNLAAAQTPQQLYAHSSCKNAIEQALAPNWPKADVQKLTFTDIPGEGMTEVSALVHGWSPTAETGSGYYYLVSATCQQVGNDFAVYNDMSPGEGGVSVKTITKIRY